MRSPTLTLVKPSAIGVVTGPFSATLFRLTESSSSTGSDWPNRLNAMTPASCRSHSMSSAGGLEDADDRRGDFRADAVAGISVMVWAISAAPLTGRRARGRSAATGSSSARSGVAERGGPIAVDVDLAEHLAVAA